MDPVGSRSPLQWIRSLSPLALACAFVPLFGALIVLRGFNSDWDFLNYHWYNAYAWLTDRRGFDVAVAHHATYYNPVADIPVYLAAQVLPAWAVGFLIGCVHGLNLLLLYCLARAALTARAGTQGDWLALALAVAGTTGGMALMIVGNASNDMTVSLFVLLALLPLVHAAQSDGDNRRWYFVAAGVAGGVAVGVKLTMAPFAFGLAAGAFALSAPLGTRLQRVALLGVGGVFGAALFGGLWAHTLWRETGNPIFPYFNHIIGSPLILDASYRDPRFLPRGVLEALAYPFLFAWDGMKVNDIPFRDVKIALAYAIVPLTVLWAVLMRRPLTGVMRVLFTTSAVSYVVWLSVFGIYRYALTLEMLAPLLIALALSLWPLSDRARLGTLAGLWLFALLATGWSYIGAIGGPTRGPHVEVAVPPIEDPASTLVVMAGVEPMGYIVPSFPPDIAFLRIDGWLDSPTSHSAFGDRMRARIDAHRGAFFGVFIDRERERAVAAFAADGLVLAGPDCATIRSNVGEPLLWCALQRKASFDE
jgi:hypothetical protein